MRQYISALLLLLLPVILVSSSIRTFGELRQMRDLFLRNRTAAVAARLETLTGHDGLQALIEDEPGVIRIEVFDTPNRPELADLWSGRELFRTEMVSEGDRQVFRAFVPFHQHGMLRITRIDVDAAAADFLLVHARHNVLTAALSSVVILLLSGYALWAMRRAAWEEKRYLEMAHLAHLGKLAAVLAHEIRTPLGTIKGFTQLALESAGDEMRPMLAPVVSETQRLERLVGDLLLYGRPPQPVPTKCSWNEVAESLREAGATVRIEPEKLRFRADPGLLRHVLGNLIRNAEEAVASDPSGCVCVSAQASGDDVLLFVEDNGPGIPWESGDKVFDSFFTTKSFGTGLGLPIAKSLTEALGGNLRLKSRPGGGVRAEVRLPGALLKERIAEVSL